jgi:hypothetical protein
MSLTANISPANMALTGNPIKLSINSSSLATYIISIGNLYRQWGRKFLYLHPRDTCQCGTTGTVI